ncbi:MAG: hypothetical protein L3J67_08260, partial [Hyphomicrobiaceae bacterium]|nr:hypothetical protein [Hyphomicrobiaceae bacterium]
MVCKTVMRAAVRSTSLLGSIPVLALTFSSAVMAHENNGPQKPVHASSHAPIGVMGEHMHKKGEWMLSYRAMNMHMNGMKKGTRNVSPNEVAQTVNPLGGEQMRMGTLPNGNPRIMTVPGVYRISPLSMDMQMHMFGLMVAPSNDVTLMAMLNYRINEMELLTYR